MQHHLFHISSQQNEQISLQSSELHKMQEVGCQDPWAKNHKNGGRNIIKQIPSDVGRYTACDCVKKLKRTTA